MLRFHVFSVFLAVFVSADQTCEDRCTRLKQRSLSRIGYDDERLQVLFERQRPLESMRDVCWRLYDNLDCMKKCSKSEKHAVFAKFVRNKCKFVLQEMEPTLKCISKHHSFLQMRCSSFLNEASRLRAESDLSTTPRHDECRFLHLTTICLENHVNTFCPDGRKIFRRLNFRDYFLSFVLPKDDDLFDDEDLDSCQIYDFVKDAEKREREETERRQEEERRRRIEDDEDYEEELTTIVNDMEDDEMKTTSSMTSTSSEFPTTSPSTTTIGMTTSSEFSDLGITTTNEKQENEEFTELLDKFEIEDVVSTTTQKDVEMEQITEIPEKKEDVEHQEHHKDHEEKEHNPPNPLDHPESPKDHEDGDQDHLQDHLDHLEEHEGSQHPLNPPNPQEGHLEGHEEDHHPPNHEEHSESSKDHEDEHLQDHHSQNPPDYQEYSDHHYDEEDYHNDNSTHPTISVVSIESRISSEDVTSSTENEEGLVEVTTPDVILNLTPPDLQKNSEDDGEEVKIESTTSKKKVFSEDSMENTPPNFFYSSNRYDITTRSNYVADNLDQEDSEEPLEIDTSTLFGIESSTSSEILTTTSKTSETLISVTPKKEGKTRPWLQGGVIVKPILNFDQLDVDQDEEREREIRRKNKEIEQNSTKRTSEDVMTSSTSKEEEKEDVTSSDDDEDDEFLKESEGPTTNETLIVIGLIALVICLIFLILLLLLAYFCSSRNDNYNVHKNEGSPPV